MHPVTHFAYAIMVGHVSMLPILPLPCREGLIYVCYVSIPSCAFVDNKKLRLDVAVRWLALRLVPTAASVSGYLVANLSRLLLLLFNRRLGCWCSHIFDRQGAIIDTSLRGALCPGAAGWARKRHNRDSLGGDFDGRGRCHHHRRR